MFGRRQAVENIVGLLETDRRITLTGAGGVGKTRLAIAAATGAVDRFPGGVWFVDLSGTGGPATTARATLRVLDVAEASGVDPARTVAGELGRRGSALLVLDNCEHSLDDVLAFVETIHDVDPMATVLATSREPLGNEGEVIWRVPSLAVPAADTPLALSSLLGFSAVEMFVDRARRAEPSFRLTDVEAPTIAEICRQLDGIPLAIELAAARLRHLSLRRIERGLDDRFRLLVAVSPTQRPRHETLAASIDWSHELLDETERLAFRRVGVFRSWFTLEAAEHVVAGSDPTRRTGVLEVMSHLVDKSLILVDRTAPDARYRMLETMRAYALARADEAGETDMMNAARLRWWTDQFQDSCRVGPTHHFVDLLTSHLDDIVATLSWACDHDPQSGLDLMRPVALAAIGAETVGALVAEFERLTAPSISHAHPVRWLRAAVPAAMSVRSVRGDDAFVSLVAQCASVAEELQDEFYTAVCQWYLAGDVESSERLREVAARRDEPFTEAAATVRIAISAAQERPDAAPALTAKAHRAAQRGTSRYLSDYAAVADAAHAATSGDYGRCIEIGRALAQGGISSVRRHSLDHLIGAGLATGDNDAVALARDLAEQAVQRGFEPALARVHTAVDVLAVLAGGGERRAPIILEHHGLITCRDAVDRGSRDVAPLDGVHHRTGTVTQRANLHIVAAWHGDDEDEWYAALDAAVRYGLRPVAIEALEGLAACASIGDAPVEAMRLLGAAQRLRTETGARWRFPCERRRHRQTFDRARDLLGNRSDQAWEEGCGLDMRDATDYVRRGRGRRTRPRHGWASLTPTELRVVEQVVAGSTNPEIADELLISRSTVKTHLEHIFVKTDTRNRSQLAAEAVSRSEDIAESPDS